MKDKVNVNIPAFDLKLSYVIPIVIIVFLGFTTIKQWSSTGRFRKENKELRDTNIQLLDTNTAIQQKVEQDSLLMVRKQIAIDSLISLDQKHLRQLYNVNRKYEKLKTDYNTANSDDKWDIFTRAIDN